MTARLGNQTVTIKYRDEVNSGLVNARQHMVIEPGIYQGGLILASSATEVQVGPLVAEVPDSGGTDNQVRVYMPEPYTKQWDAASLPYLVLRWTYTGNASEDYVDIVATSTLTVYDVIICKCSSASGAINYETRQSSTDRGNFLKVVPVFPTPTLSSVVVKPGVVWTGSTLVTVVEQAVTIGTVSTTTYVYVVPTSGAVGQTTTLSTLRGKIVLARVVKTAGAAIDERCITDMRNFLAISNVPDNNTLVYDTNGKLSVASSFRGTPDGVTIVSVGEKLQVHNDYRGNPDNVTIKRETSGARRLYVPNNGLTQEHLRLVNNQYLRSRNAENNGDVSIVKVNNSNQVEFSSGDIRVKGKLTNVTYPTDLKDAATKEYADNAVSPDNVTIKRGTSGARSLYVPADGLNQTHLRLANNQYLRGRNATNTGIVNVVKVNTSNQVEFPSGNIRFNGKLTNVTYPTDLKDAVTKEYVDEKSTAFYSITIEPGKQGEGGAIEINYAGCIARIKVVYPSVPIGTLVFVKSPKYQANHSNGAVWYSIREWNMWVFKKKTASSWVAVGDTW